MNKLTYEQIIEKLEKLSRDELNVSITEALKRLDAGEFSGTILEVELSMLRHLLGDKKVVRFNEPDSSV